MDSINCYCNLLEHVYHHHRLEVFVRKIKLKTLKIEDKLSHTEDKLSQKLSLSSKNWFVFWENLQFSIFFLSLIPIQNQFPKIETHWIFPLFVPLTAPTSFKSNLQFELSLVFLLKIKFNIASTGQKRRTLPQYIWSYLGFWNTPAQLLPAEKMTAAVKKIKIKNFEKNNCELLAIEWTTEQILKDFNAVGKGWLEG